MDIDHNLLKKYITYHNINVTRIYGEHVNFMGEYVTRTEQLKKYDIFTITSRHSVDFANNNNLIIGFNINSKIMSKCYISINDSVISTFRILKNNHQYQYLILMRYNIVKLILKRDVVNSIEVVSLNSSCVGLNEIYASCAHKNVKVNFFGPTITYHTLDICGYTRPITFHNDDDHIPHIRNYNNVKEYVNKSVRISKIRGICSLVTQLLMTFENYIVKDVLIHISVIMYHII